MDSAPLLAAIDRTRHGVERYPAPLLIAISLELWLRALEKRPAAKNDYATNCGSPLIAVA
jgi:hypothetical protein